MVWLGRFLYAVFGLAAVGVLALGVVFYRLLPTLPPIETIREIQLKVPLRIFTIDGRLIGEYGNYRRTPTDIEDVPRSLIEAILAAEDDGFYDHVGVDFRGIVRAALANLRTGGHGQGASTITMQVARNYFLSREKTYTRKLKEILLSFRLEQLLSKNEILELYVNKVFLGHRSYGFQAAALFYYDKPVSELTLAETAMLAGLPKAPSRNNPLSNPENALERRNYVLRRMAELGFVTAREAGLHAAAAITARRHVSPVEVEAPYVAEMARNHIYEKYGDRAYDSGFQVFTTIRGRNQAAADAALRRGLIAYDARRGYRGPLAHVDPAEVEDEDALRRALAAFPTGGGVRPAWIVALDERTVHAFIPGRGRVAIAKDGWSWATKNPVELLRVGDVSYVRENEGDGFALSQLPEVSGALVSLDPNDGALLALTGGFDYYLGKFNRATQARRQPGSGLKPFIYSAALNNGFTAASLVSGAPIVVEDPVKGIWRPQNYSGRFFGPTRIRRALNLSINLVSVRLLRAMGLPVVLDHLESIGFDRGQLPKGLSLALGTATLTPLEVVAAYAVFANGGYRVEPYFIARVEDQHGEIVEYSNRVSACAQCEAAPGEATGWELLEDSGSGPDQRLDSRVALEHVAPQPPLGRPVLSPENVFIMNSIMRGVIEEGTGRRARELGRRDLAGKTGTTNDFRDAWFSGFNSDVVATVWVGYDRPRSLGRRESGAKVALPVWIDYMRVALEDVPQREPPVPENVVAGYVSEKTGEPVLPDDPGGYREYFIMGTEPHLRAGADGLAGKLGQHPERGVEELF